MHDYLYICIKTQKVAAERSIDTIIRPVFPLRQISTTLVHLTHYNSGKLLIIPLILGQNPTLEPNN